MMFISYDSFWPTMCLAGNVGLRKLCLVGLISGEKILASKKLVKKILANQSLGDKILVGHLLANDTRLGTWVLPRMVILLSKPWMVIGLALCILGFHKNVPYDNDLSWSRSGEHFPLSPKGLESKVTLTFWLVGQLWAGRSRCNPHNFYRS